MRQRFEPSQQQSDYLLSRRVDALNRNSGAYLRELLASRNAKHLDRFRPKFGGPSRSELRDESHHEWEGED